MEFYRTRRFRKAYRRLSQHDRVRVEDALRRFASNPLHPSLNVERIKESIWSFRVSLSVRCTFEFSGSLQDLKHVKSVTLRNVGHQ